MVQGQRSSGDTESRLRRCPGWVPGGRSASDRDGRNKVLGTLTSSGLD